MEKQFETINGKVSPEPVNYCGLKDIDMCFYFQQGLIFLMQRFMNDTMTEGVIWDSEEVSELYTLFDVLEDVSRFIYTYTNWRIECLEKENNT